MYSNYKIYTKYMTQVNIFRCHFHGKCPQAYDWRRKKSNNEGKFDLFNLYKLIELNASSLSQGSFNLNNILSEINGQELSRPSKNFFLKIKLAFKTMHMLSTTNFIHRISGSTKNQLKWWVFKVRLI